MIQLRNLKELRFLTDSDLIYASSSKQQCDQLQLFVGNRAPQIEELLVLKMHFQGRSQLTVFRNALLEPKI